jgi:hypothetical protein
VLQGRLEKILERYLLGLSPLTEVRVSGDELCATDLAEWRGMRPADQFKYTARRVGGAWSQVRREPQGRVCVALVHQAVPADVPDNALSRYTRIVIRDGVAHGALVAHLYDLGPQRGFALAGLERPEDGDGD